MTGAAPTTPSVDTSSSQNPKPKSSTTSKSKANVSLQENYSLIRTPDEGGHKPMLDVIFEKLKYSIESEWWMEGQVVAEVLDSYEDVTVEAPRHLTADKKNNELLVEIWKEEVKQHVAEVRALTTRAKKKLYATEWKLLTNKP
jgi:hypothetical protein